MNDRMRVAIARLLIGVTLGVVAAFGLSASEDGSTAHGLFEVLMFCGLLGLVVGLVGCTLALFRTD